MLDILKRRHSIRKYREEAIPEPLIGQLKEAALRSPSSRNLRPWRFVFVTDREQLQKLSQAKSSHAAFLAGAPLGVVVCGDETFSDCWIEDCSIAATMLQLTAVSLGLGSCWIQIRDRTHADGQPAEQHVREIVGLPEGLRVLCMISIGYPAEEKADIPTGGLLWDRVETRNA